MSPTHAYTKDFKSQIVSFIEKFPGLGLHELSREMSREMFISAQTLKYYTDTLIQEGIIVTKKDGKYSRFYARDYSLEEYEEKILNCLRKPLLLNIIIIFLQYQKESHIDTIKNHELADKLKVSASTVTYNINQLIEFGILERTKIGFHLVNPTTIEILIDKYIPPLSIIESIEQKYDYKPSIIDNFINLWKQYFQ